MKNFKITEKAKVMAGAIALALLAQTAFAGEMDKGETFYLKKQYGKAVECYRKALESKLNDNNRAICWYMVGRSYTQLNRYDDAKISFMNIVNLYQNTDWLPEAYIGLGDIEYKRKQYSEALKQYRLSQTDAFMKRSGSRVLLKIARTQRNLGNTKEASECEKKILKDYPRSLEARLILKGSVSSSGKAVKAETAGSTKSAVSEKSKTSSQTSSAKSSSSSPKTKFAVQVSYTPKQDLANNYAAQLKKKGYNAYVKKGSKGYSVLVGDFATKSEAQSVCTKIRKSEKNDSYVISL